ncbi:MAG: flavodoxin family protein [Proteobacteria bacterium]|nr:flavodoxin family protein [Pseudomonadota bacterium]
MSDKKIAIGIVGSYRKQGVIDTAVSEVLSALQNLGVEIKKIYLLDYNIEFCTNCRTCLQPPGVTRGKCILKDDMEDMLQSIDSADYLIIGAPTNAGYVNALTQRFIERCVCFGYWPWGTAAPVLRNKIIKKKSILVSASAAPVLIGKYFNGTMKALKTLSKYLGAQPIGDIWVGSVTKKEIELSNKIKEKATTLAQKLIGK